jgi:hypothetical protein
MHLTDVDVFSLLIAAVCHDVGHGGLNNAFLVASGDSLALTYNDKSPLENMHAATMFEILNMEDKKILANFTADQKSNFRKVGIHAILGTDMVHHFQTVKKLSVFFELHESVLRRDDNDAERHALLSSGENRLLFCEAILHAADISNPAKPWHICMKWASKILEEFFTQGDIEKERNMTVSALCDREETHKAKSQLGFSQFVVTPFFTTLSKILPPLEKCVEQLNENRARYETIKEEDTWDEEYGKIIVDHPDQTRRMSMMGNSNWGANIGNETVPKHRKSDAVALVERERQRSRSRMYSQSHMELPGVATVHEITEEVNSTPNVLEEKSGQ